MRQRVDLHITLHLVHAVNTGQSIDAIHIHRTRAADALAARATESQCWINFTFDLDQSIQNHRAAGVEVHEIGINLWCFAIVWVPAIDLECAQIGSTFGLGPDFSAGDAGIFRERQLYHFISPLSERLQRFAALNSNELRATTAYAVIGAIPKTAFHLDRSAPVGAE